MLKKFLVIFSVVAAGKFQNKSILKLFSRVFDGIDGLFEFLGVELSRVN